MPCRGVRGATTVTANTREEILQETRLLLALMIHQNGIKPEDVASAFFTTTPDLNAAFPALAARQLGWSQAALLCGHEMDVPDALPRCIRILVHWNTDKKASEIQHVYIKEAVKLRPDEALFSFENEAALNAWIEARVHEWEHLNGRTK